MTNISLKNHIFVADIGGTNANFGVISALEGRYHIQEYYKLPSQEIVDFTKTVHDLLEQIAAQGHTRFSCMVIGVAGALCGKQHSVKPTNLSFEIDTSDIAKKTGIQEIYLINDFIAVACGYAHVENTIALTRCAIKKYAQQAFIGAGTGLGQAYAVWSTQAGCYIPVASEGGHNAFVAADAFDTQLATFIQEKQLTTHAITWENVVSGKGISWLYEFLATENTYEETAISREIMHGRFQPDFISRYSEHDERCKETFRVYVRYYARYAQQVALQGVSCAGLYIAGGIASKNKKLFLDPDFLHTFTNHAKHKKLLEKIPLFLIQDYQVSLYGAAHYYVLHNRGIL